MAFYHSVILSDVLVIIFLFDFTYLIRRSIVELDIPTANALPFEIGDTCSTTVEEFRFKPSLLPRRADVDLDGTIGLTITRNSTYKFS